MPRFLAVYTGAPMTEGGPPPDLSPETIAEGMQAWSAWMQRHADRIVETGGPLGRTKRVSKAGIEDTHNRMTGYVILEAETHEAAAALFQDHPHFAVFPGDGVEVMPVMPIPEA